MYFWGVFSKFIWIKVKEMNLFYIPLYLFIVFIIFFMPVVNLITNGMGFIFIHSLSIPIIVHYSVKIYKEYFRRYEIPEASQS